MKKALLMKEWLKTRQIFLLALLLAVAVTVYAVLMMNRMIELRGVDHLWLVMLLKDMTFVDIIKYAPLVAGIAIGIAQMAPEMTQKRLKLTLHLPYPQNQLVALMLLVGLGELLVIFLVQALIIAVYDLNIMPVEMVSRVMLTTVPWFLAGFTAYLFVTSICLEHTWLRRIIIALLGVAVLMIFFLQASPEAYNGMILIMIAFIILLTALTFGSVIRFKEGRQD
ncbi:MAG: hypothetical protein NC411_07850 [Bacteroides sp.]|nr:hypothetical protein [Bacteroides sp.]